MATITITGLDKVLHKLDTVEKIATHLGPPMEQSLDHLQRRLGRVPRKSPGAFSRLATPAQKRAYWYKVSKSPEIHGKNGYNRTGNIARRFSHRVRRHANGVTGELTNNAPGAVYVIGERQQAFHKESGFPQVDDVVENEGKAVQGYFNATIARLLRG